MAPVIDVDFTEQPPIPPAGIARANELMASGRLFRYGEHGSEELDVARLERTFADLVGARFCVAVNSCGAALAIALKAAGVNHGDRVAMNAFTLAPVPGSIAHVGAEPIFVGITSDLLIDLDDLRVAVARSGATHLLLSHMRGHIADLDAVMTVANDLGLVVVEDCAHTMGANWAGRPTGTFGSVGCFSTQTFKHVNSGEGGLLVTDDEDIAAKAILLSGSYMLYGQHGAAPGEEVFRRHRLDVPNFSMRMSALAAAVALPQLGELSTRATVWNERYARLVERLRHDERVVLPHRDEREGFVASSIQFSLPTLGPQEIADWIDRVSDQGVAVKWFGRDEPLGFTSRSDHWRYAPEQHIAGTNSVLATTCDMRIPLSITLDQCDAIADVLIDCLA